MNSLPDEILSRILFLATNPRNDSQVDAASSDAEPSVESDVNPCHGLGMVSKRWALLLPGVVRMSAAADSSSRRKDPGDQDDSLLPVPTLSTPALLRTLSHAPSVTSLTLGDGAVDFYDHAFLSSVLAACPKLTRLSFGEPRFTAAPPPFTIRLASLDSFFRAAAPQLQELALVLPPNVTEFPDSISSLRVLRLRANELAHLPDGLCLLPALRELHLNCPELWELPKNFGQLKILTHLSIGECENSPVFRLPDSLGDLPSLTSLRIDCSCHLHVPSSIDALQQLRRLELRRFDDELPDVCDAWAKLEEVALDECRMRSLPPTWLETLTRLTLRSCNHLESFPFDQVVWDPQLRHLTLEGVESIVPLHPLSRLTSLQRLKVSGSIHARVVTENAKFPVGFFSLPSLSHMSVDRVAWVEQGNTNAKAAAPPAATVLAAAAASAGAALATAAAAAAAAATAAAAAPAQARACSPLGPSLQHLELTLGSNSTQGSFLSARLWSLGSLMHLSITHLKLNSLALSAFGHLTNLRSLSLSSCFLRLPDSLSLLAPSLQSLSLEYDSSSTTSSSTTTTSTTSSEGSHLTLPSFISHLTSLTDLHLTGVFVPSPPPHLARLLSLHKLSIKKSAYCTRIHAHLAHTEPVVPENIGQLAALEWLELKGRVSENGLPASLARLGALQFLSVECDNLDRLPGALSGLSSLQEASLSCPALASLPPSFCLLSHLRILTITGSNCLVTLPTDFGSLGALRRLSIHSCSRLHSLPDSFSSLASLVHLTITKCPQLSTLPDGFGSLPRLARLTITHCDSFTHLPTSFPSLPSLRVADLSFCNHLLSL
ncbi:unnamed protein product [Closterium sp. NIES-53]